MIAHRPRGGRRDAPRGQGAGRLERGFMPIFRSIVEGHSAQCRARRVGRDRRGSLDARRRCVHAVGKRMKKDENSSTDGVSNRGATYRISNPQPSTELETSLPRSEGGESRVRTTGAEARGWRPSPWGWCSRPVPTSPTMPERAFRTGATSSPPRPWCGQCSEFRPSAWEEARANPRRGSGGRSSVAAILQRHAMIASAGGLICAALTRKAEEGGFSLGPMLMALIGSRKREKARA